MNECDSERERMISKDVSALEPRSEAGLLAGLYSIYKSPAIEVARVPCAADRAEGILASRILAVRSQGEDFSKEVFDTINQLDPKTASMLRNATISSDGHIVFK